MHEQLPRLGDGDGLPKIVNKKPLVEDDRSTIATSRASGSTDPSAWLRNKARHGPREKEIIPQDMFVFRKN